MPLLRPRLVRPLLALFALVIAAGSCGPDLLGPGGARRAVVALNPEFSAVRLDGSGHPLSISSIVSFTRVRVVLLRSNGDTAVDRMVDFPADADSVALAFNVTLSPTAPAEGESLGATMRFLTAAGDTVFAAGPVSVQARPTSTTTPPAPVTIPVSYVGPGKDATSLSVAPDSVVAIRGQTLTLTATARDAQGAVLPNTPVAYTSSDTTQVRVTLGGGVATIVGARGSALVIAQTLTGQRDTARISITPTPTAIAVVSGNNQQVRQGSAFAQPLRVRVTAIDGLGVSGTPVDFAVTAGLGTLSAARVTTDTAGFAEVIWTAGDTAMVGSVVASVATPALSTTFSGTQLSSGPTSLVFAAQPPATVVTGDTLTSVKVVVLDATLDTVRTFAGAVTLTLTGGPAGASLLGTATVNAVAGVARFPGLSVNRAGTGYRLNAQLPGRPAVATVPSTPFTATQAPAALVELLTGSGRVTGGGTPFPDSIRVWVKDRFGIGVPGATVSFTIVSGGGSVSPAPATTNADGIAAAQWTAGLSGPQAVDVTVAGVAPVRVTGAVPSAIVVSSGSGQSALFGQPFPLPVIFTVLGDSGNVLASAPVALTVTGGGTISATQTFSDAQGLVRVNWTAGSIAGTATVTATIPGTTLSATASGQQGSAGPSFMAFAVPPRGIVAGDTIPTTVVAIYNGVNELLPNYRGTMSVALTGGTPGAQLLGPTTVPVDSGSSAGWFRNLTVDRAGTGYRLVATLANPTLTVTSDTFSVAPAPAVALTLTSGGGQQALGGTTLPAPIVVTTVDQFGFPVPGVPVTFSTTNSDASVSVGSATTDSLGRASTQWTVGLFGSQSLTVSASGIAVPLTVRATIPQALTLVDGGGQSALFGEPFPTPISFRVLGDSARPMAGIPVDFGVFGGGTVSQVRDTSDATGLVSVTWTAGTLPGSATLTATVSGMSLSAGVSGQQASPAPALLTLTGAPSQVVAGDSMPPVQVQVLNGLGQPVTSYTGGVRLTLGGGVVGAQLLGTTVRQAVAGVATFPGLAIDRAGSGYRLFAALDPTQPGLQTNSDTITVTPAPPTAVVLVSGGGQTAPEFIPLADSIVVRVVDRFGFGVPGVTVQFAVLSGAGTVSAASVVSAGGATPGRAAVRWTVGPVGAQQLKVGLPGVPDLVVTATSVSASGPPLLFIGQGDGASLRIGQPTPITLFLTSPSPTPVEVTFSTTDPAVVNWEVPSWQFAAGTTQLVTELLPVGVGSAVVRVTSSAGSDSLVVYVDSATVGFRDPSWAYTAVGDTIRTQVVLDAPAPFGGATVTVTSADPSALLVAPGTGRGLSDPSCTYCGQLQAADTGATEGLVAPPGASATIQIPAGQLSGELVLLPIGLPTAGTGSPIAITVSATGRVGNVRNVVIDAPTLSAFPWDATLPVGHLVQGGVEVGTPMRRAVPVTIRTLDPTILAVEDSVASIDAFDYGTSDLRFARALAVGVGRLLVESPGFVPDTFSVTVAERGIALQSLGATSLTTGQEVGVRALLGVAPSPSNGFIASAPTASPVPVTFVSLDTTVIRVLRSERSADGEFGVIVGLRAVGTGIAPVVASAPGYGADTLQFLVSGVTPTIALYGPLTPGVVATVDVSLGTYGAPQASSVEYTVTAEDSTIVGVLTPLLRIPAGFQSGTLRLEARAPGSTTLSLSAPGMTTTVQLVNVASTGSFAYVYAPSSVIVDSTGSYASVYLSGEAAARTVLQVRSTDPAVLAVIDSVLTIPAGAQYGGAPRIRGLAPGAAQVILRRDGVDIDTSTVVQVVAPSITAYVEGNLASVVSLGPDTRLPMVIEVSQQAATNLTFTVQGPLGTTIVAGDSLPLESWGGQPFVLRGSASMPTSGIDTVTITRPGASPFSFFVTPSRIRSNVLVGPIALGQAAQVGAYVGLADGPTPVQFIESGIPRRFRVVSLDTTRLRVVEDTLQVESDGAVIRHASVRAVGVGSASVVLLPIDAAAATRPDTPALFIDRARLYAPVYPGDPLRR
ncbi:MAG: beta strand repeat-containing protein, partial [Gemmatimonadaceae bacterium]